MLVSYRHEFIFVKTRKTAGSAVELAFEPFVRSPGATAPGDGGATFETAESVTPDGIIGARSKTMKEEAVYFDHMQAHHLRKAVGARVWSRFFKFCTIRNPWDKTVSAFYFGRPSIREKSANKQIDLFRRWIQNDDSRKLHDRDIYYINMRPAMDDYIRYDRLAEDVARIANRLHLPVADLPQVHHESRNRAIDYRAFYDDAARNRIGSLYHREIEDFGWRFEGGEELRFPAAEPLPVSSNPVGRLLERLVR